MIVAPPIATSACPTRPSLSTKRSAVSFAPNTFAYHSIASCSRRAGRCTASEFARRAERSSCRSWSDPTPHSRQDHYGPITSVVLARYQLLEIRLHRAIVDEVIDPFRERHVLPFDIGVDEVEQRRAVAVVDRPVVRDEVEEVVAR